MNNLTENKGDRQVGIWLLIGVGMIMIQVLLGGITRLTESGLSITEWKPITGALPPLNHDAWQLEFDKYRTTDQFKYVHENFSLRDFKFIFFWEWSHRLWARLMGMVFLVGFVYFLVRKKFKPSMIIPMAVLFILGALQGAIGWIMVKSGLVPEKFFVGHIELTTHLIAALILLSYTLWFALSLLIKEQQKVFNTGIHRTLSVIIILLFFQLIYGGFMAGLHAAATAPTWPDINGQFIPAGIGELSPWAKNLINNNLTVHFIHRGLAYLLLISVIIFFFRSKKIQASALFSRFRFVLLMLIFAQVLLGITTVLNATNTEPFVWLGVAHQFTAMLLVMCMVCLLFIVRNNKLESQL
jgi:cytochrome c oxidase assembly protein subunit 15